MLLFRNFYPNGGQQDSCPNEVYDEHQHYNNERPNKPGCREEVYRTQAAENAEYALSTKSECLTFLIVSILLMTLVQFELRELMRDAAASLVDHALSNMDRPRRSTAWPRKMRSRGAISGQFDLNAQNSKSLS